MERMLARQVCDAVTILVAAGAMDYNGHASARIPAAGFAINTSASNRRGMTPQQVCHVDAAGKLLSGDRPPNEVHLHAAIYAARPEVQAVVHCHPKWTTLFTATGTAIPAVMPQGCLVADLPVYPASHSISSAARGHAVAQTLGSAPGILLSSHGSIFTGADLVEAVALAIYAEQNAERAYTARVLGEARPIAKTEAEEYRTVLRKPNLYQKCWDFFLP
jgi:L-fuculose-phosphate aldolase